MNVLTDEQQAIVAHSHGPALVFAVAGSGKTTAMIHRIRRLVDDRVVPPQAILATSFGEATVRDIQRLLADSPNYREVGACTLHSIGFQALKAARSLGYFHCQQVTDVDFEEAPNVLFFRTLKQARSLGVSFAKELNDVDKDDFLDYVSTCKGNLQYPDLEKAGLPEAAMGVASQAPQAETIPWYLDLYRLFEEVRLETGLLTFDDMLMSGWEMLFRHPRVLADVSGRYQSVMVDEFQDVNLAQSEILDLITAAHRNYMVIGDEDQTIFEWRGASPRFILDFAKRYGAKKYTISDNFRCHASQVALANRVISQNSVREPKRVQLTKGFGGNTFVIAGTPETQSNHVTSEIKAEQGNGRKLADMVILVRKYAQTPVIEQALTREQIPYRIVGSQPFYKRPEIAALLNYLRLAVYERKLRAAERLSSQEIRAFRDTWLSVYNIPTRYLQREAAEEVLKEAVYRGASLSTTLSLKNPGRTSTAAARIDKLVDTLDWLAATKPDERAYEVLSTLVERIGYRGHLLSSSGFAEVGESRLANVEAFLAYSKGKRTAAELLAHIEEIGQQYRDTSDDEENADYLKVMTIHRSKGLQWPVVFIPDCNDGILPPKKCENVEEERRLLYVAITRTMEALHLLVNKEVGVCPFLRAADYRGTLESVQTAANLLAADPERLCASDLERARQYIQSLGLERYVRLWWEAPEEHKRRLLEPAQVGSQQEQIAAPARPTTRRTDGAPPPAKGTDTRAGMRVRHPALGLGTVIALSDKGDHEVATACFDQAGDKKFVLALTELGVVEQQRLGEATQIETAAGARLAEPLALEERGRGTGAREATGAGPSGDERVRCSSTIRYCERCRTNRKFSNGQCPGCAEQRLRIGAIKVLPREKREQPAASWSDSGCDACGEVREFGHYGWGCCCVVCGACVGGSGCYWESRHGQNRRAEQLRLKRYAEGVSRAKENPQQPQTKPRKLVYNYTGRCWVWQEG